MTQRVAEQAQQPVALRDGQLQTLALALFNGTVAAHQLGERERGLLQYAAVYYAVARASDVSQPGLLARDVVLNATVEGLKPNQQSLVASVLAFQREKLRRGREVAFLRLDKHDQEITLRLAAVLGLADALRGVDALVASDRIATTVQLKSGVQPDGLEERAERWRKFIGPLHIHTPASDDAWLTAVSPSADPPNLVPPPLLTSVDIDKLRGDEPIAEGGRRMLRRQFERMLAREEDVRAGEDPEDVHQMRVATRRLRASLQIVEPIYDADAIRTFRRKLRDIAAALGAVRDRDVFLIDLAKHRDALPNAQRATLEPLVARVESERAVARRDLLDTLESRRYARFKHTFAVFLTTPDANVAALPETGVPSRVRDRAGSMLWRRYEEWRAFEAALPDAHDETLHQARIAGKRLRYTIEFFADALGPKTDEILDPLAALQETLGSLQDAVVAREAVGALGMAGDAGAQEYVASRGVAREQHLAAFPRAWEKVASATYRRRLFELIVKM